MPLCAHILFEGESNSNIFYPGNVLSKECAFKKDSYVASFLVGSCSHWNASLVPVLVLQLIGVPVSGLEPEFQPVISHLLPQILAHKQDSHDPHLQVHHT